MSDGTGAYNCFVFTGKGGALASFYASSIFTSSFLNLKRKAKKLTREK